MNDDDTDERILEQPDAERGPVERYEIRIRGRLGARWTAWFDGCTVVDGDDGTTLISGPVVDQAALHGLLQRLRDLGLTLLSLTRTAPGEPVEHPISPNTIHTTGAPR